MGFSWWIGIGAGLAVVGGHAALRVVTHWLALRASERRTFLLFELGGLGARMALVFGAVALVLLTLPVHVVAFVSTVIALLLLSMVIETRRIMYQMDRGTLES